MGGLSASLSPSLNVSVSTRGFSYMRLDCPSFHSCHGISILSRAFLFRLKYALQNDQFRFRRFSSRSFSPRNGGSSSGRRASDISGACGVDRENFQAGSYGGRGGQAKSLVEDEAELSDWISELKTDSFRVRLSSESDDDSNTDRNRGRTRDNDRNRMAPSTDCGDVAVKTKTKTKALVFLTHTRKDKSEKKERKIISTEAMSQHLLLLLLIIISSWVAVIALTLEPSQNCPEKCGDVTIPFPFGIGEGCYLDTEYSITCNTSYSPPKPFLGDGQHEVLSIPLDHEILIEGRQNYASYCPNPNLTRSNTTASAIHFNLKGSQFMFSNRSRFIAIGCNTMATISEFQGLGFASGCLSFCTNHTVVEDGSCEGKGCCESNIPEGLQGLDVSVSSAGAFHGTWENSTCSFAFLAAGDLFTFQASDLSQNSLNRKSIPVAVDWAIGNSTCEAANGDPICGQNSNCTNSVNGSGYRCYCNEGYEGNPYLSLGCHDINECVEERNKSCVEGAKCTNTIGSFECRCPDHHHGDGRVDGMGCMHNTGTVPLVALVTGTGLGIIFLFACVILLYWAIKRRRLIRLREKFFEQNGGLLLQQHIATRKGVADIAKIFTIDDIKKATNNFDESRILGQGGHGTVYKGILSDNRAVAIKKSKLVDQTQIIQFINEVDILSQINHRNVVKLLGCCLETEVPLLVYEFISSGTLYEHIHEENNSKSICWEDRLRVAVETAGALAYLHSAHSIPVLHRDVKSTNILLDDNFTAKVSDFGASRLAPMDRMQMTTLVQGTFGYVDPEGFYTGQLTDKSDVYSFGVVLAELLTGEKPLSFDREEEQRSLAVYFVSSMANDKLFQILDSQVIKEGNRDQLLGVANLVMKCLKVKGEKRPTMKEVAAELYALRMSLGDPWKQQNHMETDYQLPGEPSTLYVGDSTGQESVESNFMLALRIAR